MGSFSIFDKKMTSVIRLEFDADMLNDNFYVETPVCKFDGLDDTEWSVTCNLKQRILNFDAKLVNNDNKRKFNYFVTAKSSGSFDERFGLHIKIDDLKNCIVYFKVVLDVTAVCYITDCQETYSGNSKLQVQPFELIEHIEDSFDLLINVGNNCYVSAHKAFLSMISPVFKAMFTNDTREAQTGVLEIKDFDYATVKSAIDLLYGHLFEPKSIQDVLQLLRFAEKYIIKAVVIRLETWVNENITVNNLHIVIHYAWNHSNENLKKICSRFYRQHMKPELRDVKPAVIADVIRRSLS